MTTRRSFIKSSAVYSASLLVAPSLLNYNHKYIGLQLYTVRDAMQSDPAGTLARVAKIGYNSVEGATYTGTQKFYGMEAPAFSRLLKQNGLVMLSSHYRLGEEKANGETVKGTLMTDWDKAVDDAAAVGIKYMVCAFLAESERGGLDHYKQIAEQFNKAGERCKKAGIQLCYHNHAFEFDKQGGKYPYEILLDDTDKNLVKMEMDIYWVSKAGQDPIAIINQHPGRFPLWHVKDMDKTPEHNFTEVGNGSIDFKKIFKYADKAGLQYFFVEQDKTPGDPFNSIAQSINYIKKNLV
ncbi:sugar phosphate isomerase/epimerase family protein [Mucilaginibacter arboris]|uniref:TIM barrel protein n=1 Tax=Mucilaginibacter arboris TaxID=2682090 RepID=A0A7K1SYG3_9SPHI|nr:sugar phosphate isomerase/epimerase [Mucilaginibacter arboris]MVN22366.1 TIM barrel protein [Mucilaginibacter arboris]